MGHRGSGRYARGDKAIGICERCSKKVLRRTMVYDGQFPDLLVCPECWDPKHPQEYLPPAFDPVTIYDPTGDPDKAQANVQVITFPVFGFGADVSMPLQIGVSLSSVATDFVSGVASFDAQSFDVVSFDTDDFSLG